MSKVSVIVPNYNHAPYLRQRLDSIFNQTFQDFEVIILDDCSTDNSKEIIESYRTNPHVSYIVYNEINSGSPFKQWAKGFNLAKGDYIWIAESDDWAETNLLEVLLSKIEHKETNSLAFCTSILHTGPQESAYPINKFNFKMDGKKFIKKKMLFDNTIYNASAVIFSRNSLNHISKKYQDFRSAGDYQFWLEICLVSTIYYTKDSLNHFRLHNSSTTTRNSQNFLLFDELLTILLNLREVGTISRIQLQSVANHYAHRLKKIKAPQQNISQWEALVQNKASAFLYKKLYFLCQVLKGLLRWM